MPKDNKSTRRARHPNNKHTNRHTRFVTENAHQIHRAKLRTNQTHKTTQKFATPLARTTGQSPSTKKAHQRPTGTETVPSSFTLTSRVLPPWRAATSTPAGGDAAAVCAPFVGDSARNRKAGDEGGGRTPRRRADSWSQLTCGVGMGGRRWCDVGGGVVREGR